jgi:hypothetical protein
MHHDISNDITILSQTLLLATRQYFSMPLSQCPAVKAKAGDYSVFCFFGHPSGYTDRSRHLDKQIGCVILQLQTQLSMDYQ